MDLLRSEEYPDVRGLMGTYIVKPNRARATQCLPPSMGTRDKEREAEEVPNVGAIGDIILN